jgi:hypothetical protein
VHEAPIGAVIDENNNVMKDGAMVLPNKPCAYKPKLHLPAAGMPANWNAWVSATAPTNAWAQDWFTGFDGDWRVPPNPQVDDNQQLYYFISLQSSSSIIQPVLQYGRSPAGGGYYWAMANWYVYNNNTSAVKDTLKQVYPSDRIHGELASLAGSCTANGQCGWNINFSVNGSYSQDMSVLSVPGRFRWADKGVLESYNVMYCSRYPQDSSELFYNILPFMPGPSVNAWNFTTLNWVPGHGGTPTICKFNSKNDTATGGADTSARLYWKDWD